MTRYYYDDDSSWMPLSGGGGGSSLPLDDAPAAVAAFAFRKLRSAYAGPCLRVRRSSDNAELDIDFVGSALNTALLLAHCVPGNGFVVTWYDQSGNGNDATQATAASQPQIVTSGALSATDDDGHPAATFNGTTQAMYFNGAAASISGDDHANSLVLKLYATSVAGSYDPISFSLLSNANSRHHLRLVGSTGRFSVMRGDGTAPITVGGDGTPFTVNTWLLWTQAYSGTAASWWVNGVQDKLAAALNVGPATFDRATLGARDGAGTLGSHLPGRISCALVFDVVLSTPDRQALEAAL